MDHEHVLKLQHHCPVSKRLNLPTTQKCVARHKLFFQYNTIQIVIPAKDTLAKVIDTIITILSFI